MQGSSEVLSALHSRGVRVWLENGQLRYRAPRNALLPDDLSGLRSLKAEIVEMLGQADPSVESVLRPRPAGVPVPLVSGQMRLWRWYAQSEAGRGIRLCKSAVRVVGPLDIGCLQQSLDIVVDRHESLRTRFVVVDGVPWQQIERVYPCDWSVVDVSGPQCADDPEWQQLTAEFFRTRIDLSRESLLAVRVFRISSQEHVLAIALDHLIADGTSSSNLMTELWTCYRQLKGGIPVCLPEIPLQFADYAVWLQRSHGAWLQLHEPYWRAQVTDSPPCEIPNRDDATPSENPVGVPVSFSFRDELSQKLRELAAGQRTPVSVVVLAVFVLSMSRWCGRRDLLITFISTGRYRPELQPMIGCLSDQLFLRMDLAPRDRFRDVLDRLKLQLSNAYEHQSCGGVRSLMPAHASDLTFNWQQTGISSQKVDVDLEWFSLPCAFEVAVKFMPLFFDAGTSIRATFLHRPDLLATSSVDQFGRDLRQLARMFVADPNQSIGSVLES